MQSCWLYMHLFLVDPLQLNLSKEDRFQRYEIIRFSVKLHLSGRVGCERVFIHNWLSCRVLLSLHHGNSSSDWSLSHLYTICLFTICIAPNQTWKYTLFCPAVGQPKVKETRRELGGIVIGKAEKTQCQHHFH